MWLSNCVWAQGILRSVHLMQNNYIAYKMLGPAGTGPVDRRTRFHTLMALFYLHLTIKLLILTNA